ncbi:MAG: hypothetical protein JWN48_1911 [Myxococcaceae bacterium]|nr:hypothetical protein [Myxococcaceae bacterium]
MKPRAQALARCLLVCSLALVGLSSSARADGSDNITLANLPGPGGGVDWGRAETVLDARPDEVLAILQDYSKYAGLFPHFETSRVLSQRGTDAIVYLEAKVLHGAATLWGQVRMSSSVPPAAPLTHVVEAKMMKGKSNIAQLLARWEIQPVDDGQRTKVSFQLLVDPDLPVPDAIVSNEMKNSAGQAVRALRRRAGQHAAYAARPQTSM